MGDGGRKPEVGGVAGVGLKRKKGIELRFEVICLVCISILYYDFVI